MKLNEFIGFRKNCLVCDSKNLLMMVGTLNEEIGDSKIHCMFSYMMPIVRKNFTTFSIGNFAIYSPNEFIDVDTLDKEKYKTFMINKDGYATFDNDFIFKMKLNFKVFCPDGHYSYDSRLIRISNKSPDITKGYPVSDEVLANEKYKVVSNHIENTTSIYNESSKKPTVIPYMDVANFPYDDPEKFNKKVENILLLA